MSSGAPCTPNPFVANMRHLHETMRTGLARGGGAVQLFYRCWGSHDHDHHYYQMYADLHRLNMQELAREHWIPAYVQAFQDASLQFKPSRDIPQFQEYLQGCPDPVRRQLGPTPTWNTR